MPKAIVVSIHTAPAATAPVLSLEEAHAVPGKGLEGDRYFKETGTFSADLPGPDHELTLIEIEKIEAFKREYGVELAPSEARRNIVTRGVLLNDLVGQKFRIGEVTLCGIRLCEPCSHLARLTKQQVLYGLVHKGGLRAEILTDGIIHVGDPVEFC